MSTLEKKILLPLLWALELRQPEDLSRGRKNVVYEFDDVDLAAAESKK